MLACCAALALPGCSALPAQPTLEAAPPVALPSTRQIDLAAGPGGPLHRIMLAVPPGPPPAGGYPVLYVLDGNLLFAMAIVGAPSLAIAALSAAAMVRARNRHPIG